MPNIELILSIAKIVSYNVFQMDGLKYIIPYSEETIVKPKDTQLSLFDEMDDEVDEIEVIKEGTKVKIKDWSSNKMITFESLIIEGGMNV